MESYYTFSKMKRKELDGINDDFLDFSFSSPARKIRRLDADLPPIIEEEEAEIPIEFEQSELEQSFGNNSRKGLVIEELPNAAENEERALVVFKPVNAHWLSTLRISQSQSIHNSFQGSKLKSCGQINQMHGKHWTMKQQKRTRSLV